MGPGVVHYIPIVTTILAIPFALEIYKRYREHPERLHLLWWALGIATYGVGTFTESLTTLIGWNEPTFRAWYISGALLGGAPLAQGTVYLLLSRRTAHVLTAVLLTFVADRLHPGRGPSSHRARARMAVGAPVQPIRQYVRGGLPDRRRHSFGAALQHQSRDAPSRDREHPDRDWRHSARHRRHGHAHGLHRSPVRDRTGRLDVDVGRIPHEHPAGRRACDGLKGQAP